MIKRLEHDIAMRIAAGEVIEKPSSVAKELIENSIDASAANITLYIEQGGKTSLVVEDDGAGIASGELHLALERYATSKINSIDDLERISTLGYRGEALASIAAVSRVEIRSRQRGADEGGLIRCEGGTVTICTENPCQPGTRVQVEDLFFNLPARRKFLKTASAELRRIIQIVNDYALIHHDITFRVQSDGRKILEHISTDSMDEVLSRRWGTDARIYFSESSASACSVKIWWNPVPDSRRVITTVFVNGRRIQDSTVKAAICGGDSAAHGEWVVFIDMPPDQLDVNIHPTKEEVRFRRSQEIFKMVYDNSQNVFARRFSSQGPAFEGNPEIPQGTVECSASHSFFDRSDPVFSPYPWNREYKTPNNRVASSEDTVFTPSETEEHPYVFAHGKNYIGQTSGGFLIFDFSDGIAIIDPHAAHERILFEEISESFKDNVVIQNLAVPVEIPSALLPELALNREDLNKLGFTDDGAHLTGVPLLQGRGRLSPVDMLRSAIRGIETEQDPSKRDREVWWRLARLACRDAVKLGQRFEKEEAEVLLERLEKCCVPYTCPHGRPTIFIMDNKKLEEWFER
jgi:DNA mismatch repair protein MutL